MKAFDNRPHRIDYQKWHKCARCNIFTLFDDEPNKTMFVCPDCWEKWKDLPQYTVTKKMPVPIKRRKELPIEFLLLYILGCAFSLLIIAYYLFGE